MVNMVEINIKHTVVNPFEEAKKERLAWLSEFLISKENIPIDFKKMVSILEYRYGISKKTSKDYIITAIIYLNLIIINGIIQKKIS